MKEFTDVLIKNMPRQTWLIFRKSCLDDDIAARNKVIELIEKEAAKYKNKKEKKGL